MIKLRKNLAQYQENFFLLFVLALGFLMSMGLESQDRPYRIVFAIVSVCWALKMFSTDFTLREIIWMIVITLFLGVNFLANHEKTLILTAMGIFSAKNMSLEKVFKYGFWSKFAATASTILLAAVGIIENLSVTLPKNGVMLQFNCYGYGHPNITFGNIVLVFILAILAYKDKLKWYVYLLFTLILFGAYQLLMSRTGLVVWGCLMIMLVCYKLSLKWKLDKIYLSLFCILPVLLAVITCAVTVFSINNPAFSARINFYLTGRINLIIGALGNMGNILLGQVPRHMFDNLNFYLLYNYGIVILLFSLLSYTYAMWVCLKQKRHYEVIILGAIVIFGFMEYYVASIAWNLSLLCLSRVLFKEE